MVELNKVGELYFLAHKLVSANPDLAVCWFAVVRILNNYMYNRVHTTYWLRSMTWQESTSTRLTALTNTLQPLGLPSDTHLQHRMSQTRLWLLTELQPDFSQAVIWLLCSSAWNTWEPTTLRLPFLASKTPRKSALIVILWFSMKWELCTIDRSSLSLLETILPMLSVSVTRVTVEHSRVSLSI